MPLHDPLAIMSIENEQRGLRKAPLKSQVALRSEKPRIKLSSSTRVNLELTIYRQLTTGARHVGAGDVPEVAPTSKRLVPSFYTWIKQEESICYIVAFPYMIASHLRGEGRGKELVGRRRTRGFLLRWKRRRPFPMTCQVSSFSWSYSRIPWRNWYRHTYPSRTISFIFYVFGFWCLVTEPRVWLNPRRRGCQTSSPRCSPDVSLGKWSCGRQAAGVAACGTWWWCWTPTATCT